MNRLLLAALLGLCWFPDLAPAQVPTPAQDCVQGPRLRTGDCTNPGGRTPGCNCPQCRQPPCSCPQCKPPCKPPCQPPITPRDLPPPAEEAPPTPRGMYVAPPRTGTEVGESRAIAINGMAIKFPAMRLQLPSIELPSVSRMRQKAHMRIDSATAPYVEETTYASGFDQGPSRQYLAEDARDQTSRDLNTRDLPPGSCSKSRELHLQAREAELDERMRRLDETESCLREQMRKLQECLQGLEGPRQQTDPSAEIPTPEPSSEGRRRRPVPLPPVANSQDPYVRQSQYVVATTPSGAELPLLERLPPVTANDDAYPTTRR